MSYQVIARKWRPQKFDDVVGQQAVTRTLRNALGSKRLAQAFVFAGPPGVDNVREVIIAGLGILPVRNRYKIFIIDEVHQLSSGSFNALLKSIEEPPPHVVFMMATTELDKIPETVLSRSQVYEFRTISSKSIAAQLRKIVDSEKIQAGEDALQLVAR